MRLRIRRLEDVVRHRFIADLLVDEHRGVTIQDRRGGAMEQIRMLWLSFERLQSIAELSQVEHLRHAEVQIAARLLPVKGVEQWRERGIAAAHGKSRRRRQMDVRVHETRRQELAAAIQPRSACRRLDGLRADLCNTIVVNEY